MTYDKTPVIHVLIPNSNIMQARKWIDGNKYLLNLCAAWSLEVVE